MEALAKFVHCCISVPYECLANDGRKDILVFALPKVAPIVQQLGFTDIGKCQMVAHHIEWFSVDAVVLMTPTFCVQWLLSCESRHWVYQLIGKLLSTSIYILSLKCIGRLLHPQ